MKNDDLKPYPEVVLRQEELLQRLRTDAGRFHTKWLFGLWFLLTFCLVGMAVAGMSEDRSGKFLAVIGITSWLVIFTGAYTFQEVRRIHRRLDAIWKLMEKDHRTRD